jgi:gliding motility-associated protein GldC
MNKKKSEIKIDVTTDENNVPESIYWSAEDGGIQYQDTKATFLSVWDPQNKESLRIDLWTKDMPLDEMQQFFHQTLVSMSSTYYRATNDEKMTETMRDFCDYFAEKLNLNQNNDDNQDNGEQ